MSSITFSLKNKNSKKATPINYYINFSKRERLKGSTFLKIEPKYWDQGKQKVRGIAEISDIKDEINTKLKKFSSFIETKLIKYKNNSIDEAKKELKNDIAIYFGKIVIKKEVKLTFYTATEKFILQSKGRIIERTGKPITKCTLTNYRRTINRIIEFEKETKYKVTFETINLDFYYSFKEYLEELDFSLNTIGKFIKTLKIFLNYATEQGYNTNLSYKSIYFKVDTETSEQIYLNSEELQRIIKLNLQQKPILNNARDLFIIGAYTGLRVSDFNVLSKENIVVYKGQRMFKINVKKTGKDLPIPIHPVIEKILSKYKGSTPKKMKHQDINDALSKIGKLAKINQIITTNITKGGKTITNMNPKYDLIKNHTARRSFCTNAYIIGMDALDIMAISGHKSYKTFMNYIKIEKDERALKIAQSPFFNPSNNLMIVK